MENEAPEAEGLSSQVARARRRMADEALPGSADVGGPWHEAAGAIAHQRAVRVVEPAARKGGGERQGGLHQGEPAEGEGGQAAGGADPDHGMSSRKGEGPGRGLHGRDSAGLHHCGGVCGAVPADDGAGGWNRHFAGRPVLESEEAVPHPSE